MQVPLCHGCDNAPHAMAGDMCWTLRAETMLLEHTGLLTVTLNELSYSLVLVGI